MVICAFWIFSAATAEIVTLLGIYKTGSLALEGVISYTFFSMDIFITVTAISTFVYFYLTIGKLLKREKS